MGKKLYVGNLSYNVDSSALEQLFAQHGQVASAQVITDRETGRSKGFGFVEMGNDDEAQAAIAALNGHEHDGRALTVNEARPREGGGDGRPAAGRGLAPKEGPGRRPGSNRRRAGPRRSTMPFPFLVVSSVVRRRRATVVRPGMREGRRDEPSERV